MSQLHYRPERSTSIQEGPPDERTITASDTLKIEDGLVICDASSTNITLTLPLSTTLGIAAEYTVAALGEGTVSIVASGAETVGGSTSIELHGTGSMVRLVPAPLTEAWDIVADVKPRLSFPSLVTANYQASFGEFIRFDSSGGGFSISLPEITAGSKGMEIHVQESVGDATLVNIIRSGSDTILGLTTVASSSSLSHIGFISDGDSTWWLIS